MARIPAYAQAGAEKVLLLTERVDTVLHMRGLPQRRYGFLRILRCAANQSYPLGRTTVGQVPVPVSQSEGMTSNLAGALAYPLGAITGILFLKIEPYKFDPFVRFHAWQSIFLSLSYGVFFMGWIGFIGMLFDLRLGFLFSFVGPVMVLLQWACILLLPFMMYKAFKFQYFSLPIIGRMAARRAG